MAWAVPEAPPVRQAEPVRGRAASGRRRLASARRDPAIPPRNSGHATLGTDTGASCAGLPEQPYRVPPGTEAQRYFADETHEYPLAASVESAAGVPSIAELDPPDIDLSNLDDLRGTLDLMRSVGVLP